MISCGIWILSVKYVNKLKECYEKISILIFNKYSIRIGEVLLQKRTGKDGGQGGASIVMATNWKIFLTLCQLSIAIFIPSVSYFKQAYLSATVSSRMITLLP